MDGVENTGSARQFAGKVPISSRAIFTSAGISTLNEMNEMPAAALGMCTNCSRAAKARLSAK
jgi:hypothetical protein